MKFTGYVSVRLNSKRLPRKSILKINGTSLVERALKTLEGVKEISETVLYCTDNEIEDHIQEPLSYKRINRPDETNTDHATFEDVLGSAIDRIETDYVVFLCCTSPFIKPETISKMIQSIQSGEYDSAFAATEAKTFCWYKNSPLNYSLETPTPRTQDLDPVLMETSGLYIFSKEDFKRNSRRIGINPYIKIVDDMESWDIDTPKDFLIAKSISEVINDLSC